jgi:hypothetical protein
LWFRGILVDLERKFNSTADVYRAQIQRFTTPESTPQPQKAVLLEDISTLEEKLDSFGVINQSESQATT